MDCDCVYILKWVLNAKKCIYKIFFVIILLLLYFIHFLTVNNDFNFIICSSDDDESSDSSDESETYLNDVLTQKEGWLKKDLIL